MKLAMLARFQDLMSSYFLNFFPFSSLSPLFSLPFSLFFDANYNGALLSQVKEKLVKEKSVNAHATVHVLFTNRLSASMYRFVMQKKFVFVSI